MILKTYGYNTTSYVFTTACHFFLNRHNMKLKNDEEKAFDLELSKIIKARRDELNLTQEYLSFHSGVTRITIGKWEKGEKTPISFDLYNVLKVLYKDPSEFWAELYKNYEKTLSPIQKASDKKKYMAYIEQMQKGKKGNT